MSGEKESFLCAYKEIQMKEDGLNRQEYKESDKICENEKNMEQHSIQIIQTNDSDHNVTSPVNGPEHGLGTTNQPLFHRMDIEESVGRNSDERESDPYALVKELNLIGKPWKELDRAEKMKRLKTILYKVLLLLGLFYSFVCSLQLLHDAFPLLGGKVARNYFNEDSTSLKNHTAGLMLGVFATVLFQNSSITTTVLIAMVSSNALDVKHAIPMVMGANIGTTITNTIVSLAQFGDRDQFRRAFAGATVHDMFNLLSVVILFPLELITNYLYRISECIVTSIGESNSTFDEPKFLTKITKPITGLVIQLDLNAIKEINKMNTNSSRSLLKDCRNSNCSYLFYGKLSDTKAGIILLIVSLMLLILCLLCIVKTLNSLLREHIFEMMKKTFNCEFPKPFTFLTGYMTILVGACLTVLLQSSSIFTSVLTPVIGLGIVTIERAYPLTLGANIGTTITGILAAFSISTEFKASFQLALCHLFFNITGIIIWYPIPFFRRIPINCAKWLGNKIALYRWFAVLYIIFVFFLIPGLIYSLSLAGRKVFLGVIIPFACIMLLVIVVNFLQKKNPMILPEKLRTWDFLPEQLRSLQYYDDLLYIIKETVGNCFFSCKICIKRTSWNQE